MSDCGWFSRTDIFLTISQRAPAVFSASSNLNKTINNVALTLSAVLVSSEEKKLRSEGDATV